MVVAEPVKAQVRRLAGKDRRDFGPAVFQAYPAQAAFIADQSKYPAFIGGRGSGKTASGAIKAVQKALRPGARGIVGAPTFPMLEQAAKPEFLKMLNRVSQVDRRAQWYEKRSENKVVLPRLDSEILFVTLDNYDRVRGINASWGWVDEAGYIPLAAWRVIIACVRIALGGMLPQLFITTTPKGKNWIYDEFVVKTLSDLTGRRQRRYTLHKATSWDNPFIYADYVEDLGYAGRFAEQEIGGEFVAFEGLVFPMFSRERHLARSVEKALPDDVIPSIDTTGWRSIIAGDVGTRNPTAVLTLRVRPDNEWVHVANEYYQRGLGSSQIIAAFEHAYRAEEALGYEVEAAILDPSAAGYILDLQQRDLIALPAENDVIEGIGRVTSALETGFSIDPECVNTATEFDSYAYSEKAHVLHSDKPVKQFDHAMDALRYGVMALPWADRTVSPVSDELAEEYFSFTGV